MQKRKNKDNKRIIFLCATICIFLVIIMSFLDVIIERSMNYRYLDKNWDIQYNGRSYTDVSLSSFRFKNVKKGEIVRLKTRVPVYGGEDDVMFLNTENCSAEVHVLQEGRIVDIFCIGEREIKENAVIGEACSFVPLPAFVQGEEIEIVLKTAKNNAFYKFTIPKVCNRENATKYFIRERFLQAMISNFLFVFGLALIGLSFAGCRFSKKLFGITCIGIFDVVIAVWIFLDAELSVLIYNNLSVTTILRYTSLYISIVPILLYVKRYYIETQKGRRIIDIFLLLNMSFLVIGLGLNIMKFLPITEFAKVEQILLGITAFAIVLVIQKNYSKVPSQGLILVTIALIIISGELDLIGYIVNASLERQSRTAMTASILVFSLFWLTNFLYTSQISYIDSSKQELLTKLAYQDYMTGLGNRALAEEEFYIYDRDSIPYAVISYDLNRLKYVNDTCGHEAGDAYIRNFAFILDEFWKENGIVTRIGGDEFLVIVPKLSNVVVNRLAKDFFEKVISMSVEKEEQKLSIAYGIAYSSEPGCTQYKEVLRCADARMYCMKRKMHNEK